MHINRLPKRLDLDKIHVQWRYLSPPPPSQIKSLDPVLIFEEDIMNIITIDLVDLPRLRNYGRKYTMKKEKN